MKLRHPSFIGKMANTYTQLNVHMVFCVTGRRNLIKENFRINVEKYISSVLMDHKCKLLAIYCNPDHLHILFGLHTDVAVSKIANAIKANSSRFLKQNNLASHSFSWQRGYGAFSVSQRAVHIVQAYINNQHEHHRAKSFRDEYIEMLNAEGIKYEDKYLFEWDIPE